MVKNWKKLPSGAPHFIVDLVLEKSFVETFPILSYHLIRGLFHFRGSFDLGLGFLHHRHFLCCFKRSGLGTFLWNKVLLLLVPSLPL